MGLSREEHLPVQLNVLQDAINSGDVLPQNRFVDAASVVALAQNVPERLTGIQKNLSSFTVAGAMSIQATPVIYSTKQGYQLSDFNDPLVSRLDSQLLGITAIMPLLLPATNRMFLTANAAGEYALATDIDSITSKGECLMARFWMNQAMTEIIPESFDFGPHLISSDSSVRRTSGRPEITQMHMNPVVGTLKMEFTGGVMFSESIQWATVPSSPNQKTFDRVAESVLYYTAPNLSPFPETPTANLVLDPNNRYDPNTDSIIAVTNNYWTIQLFFMDRLGNITVLYGFEEYQLNPTNTPQEAAYDYVVDVTQLGVDVVCIDAFAVKQGATDSADTNKVTRVKIPVSAPQ